MRGWLRELAGRSLDKLVTWTPRGTPSGRVLLVRLDAVGDFILWLREAQHLRTLFPGREIILAGNAAWSALAERLPYWDGVVAVDVMRMARAPLYRAKTLATLRRLGADLAIQPTYSRSLSRGDAIVRTSGAAQRIGAVGDPTSMDVRQRRRADGWYTRLVSTGGQGVPEIERNRRFLIGLGQQEAPLLAYGLPKVADLPPALKIDLPYFVLFPGAAWSGRQWPAEHFVELLNRVTALRGWSAVLCGSAAEHELCASIAAQVPAPSVNLAGQTSLPEFCEVVRGAQLLVGNETSAVHIAAAVGTPSVCILGGGHFSRFVPYPANFPGHAPEPVFEQMPCFGCQWRCHLPHADGAAVPCIASIPVAGVLAAVSRVMSRAKTP